MKLVAVIVLAVSLCSPFIECKVSFLYCFNELNGPGVKAYILVDKQKSLKSVEEHGGGVMLASCCLYKRRNL